MMTTNTYKKWSQNAPEFNEKEAWSASLFPNAEYHFFSECGCLVTSLAIMLRHYNIEKEADTKSFNPWILNENLIKCGAFDDAADLIMERVGRLYPLEYIGSAVYTKEKLLELYESGEPFLITVPGKRTARHFIAPDCPTEEDFVIIDPASSKTHLSEFDRACELRMFRRTNASLSDSPMIALSFDDGPDFKGVSDKILNLLEKYNVKATFFMIGKNATNNPDNVKRKVSLGHEIGSHTWDHEHYGNKVTAEEIIKGAKAIEEIIGQSPACFRSPGGNTKPLIRETCRALGMPLYHWSVDTMDWKYRDEKWVYNFVVNNVKDGDIVLMHEIYESTAAAVERMLPELLARGFRLVTCGELVAVKTGKLPLPGTQYGRAGHICNETD